MSKEYDYLIVGAGLYGAMFAHLATKKGKKCLVIDKADHVGGLCYTEHVKGIEVHKYGAHIFRTDSKKVWDFVNSICEFEPFVNAPIAKYNGKVYNLPFNMNTFCQLYGCQTPEEARKKIDSAAVQCDHPKNLEEHVLALVGKDIYNIFIKGYTEKQWGRKCSELPVSIMQRVPLRFTYDNNYYTHKYQGIPINGYTFFIERLLDGIQVETGADYFKAKTEYDNIADKVVFTGRIDEFYDCRFGSLEYRSVGFQEVAYDVDDYQGNAVVNYTSSDVPYTRSIEHKHFLRHKVNGHTIVSFEFPLGNLPNTIPMYPVVDEYNVKLYLKYRQLANEETKVLFRGHLAEYSYDSMNDIIERVFDEFKM